MKQTSNNNTEETNTNYVDARTTRVVDNISDKVLNNIVEKEGFQLCNSISKSFCRKYFTVFS